MIGMLMGEDKGGDLIEWQAGLLNALDEVAPAIDEDD